MSDAAVGSKRGAAGAGARDGASKRARAGEAKDERGRFDAVFEELVEVVTKSVRAQEMPDEVVEWMERMVRYTVPGGKLNRGLAVVRSADLLSGGDDQAIADARVLGWCVEWLQAFLLVADDVMDDSVTRRGQPCWYRVKDVGMTAVNDAFLLNSCIHVILKHYFSSRPFYGRLLEEFNITTLQTELGQLCDLKAQPLDGTVDLSRFTSDRYFRIVRYKTAFYSFYLPVVLGLVVSGAADDDTCARARAVLLPMGEYFQVQDDYLDCFGDPEVIGKIGTDIQDNKCGWLVVQALRLASPEQRAVLESHYGRKGADDVAAVKRLYAELDLKSVFEEFERDSHAKLVALIEAEEDARLKSVLSWLLGKIYKREK